MVSNCSPAQQYPERIGYINDFAGVMKPETIEMLEMILSEFKDKTGVAIVVVSVKRTGEIDEGTYATALFKEWTIGSESDDDGLLILVTDTGKRVRIEVGESNRNVITEAKMNTMYEQFKNEILRTNDTDNALVQCVATAMQLIIKNQGIELDVNFTKAPVFRKSQKMTDEFPLQFFIFLLVVVVLISNPFGRNLIMFLIYKIGMAGGGGYNCEYEKKFNGGFSTSARFSGFGGGFTCGGKSDEV